MMGAGELSVLFSEELASVSGSADAKLAQARNRRPPRRAIKSQVRALGKQGRAPFAVSDSFLLLAPSGGWAMRCDPPAVDVVSRNRPRDLPSPLSGQREFSCSTSR